MSYLQQISIVESGVYAFIEDYHISGMTPAFLSPKLSFVFAVSLYTVHKRKEFQCEELIRIVRQLMYQNDCVVHLH